MNAPFIEPHSWAGGSNAGRIISCPASVSLSKQVPDYLHRPPSVYALRGTSCHTAMTLLLEEDPPPLESLVGKTFDDYEITDDDAENFLRPAYTYAAALIDTPGAEYYVETRVTFPTIPGAYGTADLIVRIGNTVHLVDHKFGVGQRVLAIYPDGDEDVLNAQPMFYAAGARYSLPQFFAGVENIVLTILQPQSIEPDAEMVSSVTVTHAELDEFIVAFRAACEEALSESPRLKRGDHCRFCPARPICPAHTGPLLDLALFAVPAPLQLNGLFAAPPAQKEAYLKALADGLNLVDAIRDIRTALHDQAKRALENGDVVPGYTLSAGRAERRWRDDADTTCTALWHLGFERGDVIVEDLRSPKQVEIRAKARGLKVPQELIVSRRSGTSLVRCENAHLPVLGREELMRSFSEALARTSFLRNR
jgi:hypothetical protein